MNPLCEADSVNGIVYFVFRYLFQNINAVLLSRFLFAEQAIFQMFMRHRVSQWRDSSEFVHSYLETILNFNFVFSSDFEVIISSEGKKQ